MKYDINGNFYHENGEQHIRKVKFDDSVGQKGTVNPTITTEADFIGQNYVNEATQTVFVCVGIDKENNRYTWKEFTGGGGGGSVDVDGITIAFNSQGKLEVKNDGVSNDKMSTDTKIGSLANLSTTEKGSVVGAINEINGTTIPNLSTVYAPLNVGNNSTSSSLNSAYCVWNMEDNNLCKVEKKVFANAFAIPKPNEDIPQIIRGSLEVIQNYYGDPAIVVIENRFTRQDDTTHPTEQEVWYRRGTLTNSSGDASNAVYDNLQNISWGSWFALEYPKTSLTLSTGYEGTVAFCVKGGTYHLFGSIRRTSTATSNAFATLDINWANQMQPQNNAGYQVFDYYSDNGTPTLSYAFINKQSRQFVYMGGDYFLNQDKTLSISVPLGY